MKTTTLAVLLLSAMLGMPLIAEDAPASDPAPTGEKQPGNATSEERNKGKWGEKMRAEQMEKRDKRREERAERRKERQEAKEERKRAKKGSD